MAWAGNRATLAYAEQPICRIFHDLMPCKSMVSHESMQSRAEHPEVAKLLPSTETPDDNIMAAVD